MLTVSENTVKQWAAAGAQDDPKYRANLPKHLRERRQGKCGESTSGHQKKKVKRKRVRRKFARAGPLKQRRPMRKMKRSRAIKSKYRRKRKVKKSSVIVHRSKHLRKRKIGKSRAKLRLHGETVSLGEWIIYFFTNIN